MSTNNLAHPDPYVLATGPAAVRRLHVLHNVYWGAGKRALLEAGLQEGNAGRRFRLRRGCRHSHACPYGGLDRSCYRR